ncbi:RBM7 protein, partial [Quiscalus mexicanus]|nr:RBM7 protein [Quiscalus mexicanus]
QAGPVITVKIPKDRDGRPKQFAFVNFKHEESVPYGLRLLNGIKLYGRPMRIQFRSGSSHAAQDINPSCSQLGAPGTNLPGMPHPASNCSRYERAPDGMGAPGFPSSLRRQAVVRAHSRAQLVGIYCWSAEMALPEDVKLLVQRGPAGRALGDVGFWCEQCGLEALGHGRFCSPSSGASTGSSPPLPLPATRTPSHYRGREEHYEDRHRDGWSYEHRRDSYRETKWHSARH